MKEVKVSVYKTGKPILKMFMLLLAITSIHTADSQNEKRGPNERIESTNNLVCRVVVVEMKQSGENKRPEKSHFRCETRPEQEPDGQGGMTYTLELPPQFVAQHPYLEKGDTFIEILNGMAIRENVVGEPSIIYPLPTSITIFGDHKRQLLEAAIPIAVEGTRTVLVVRVTALDSEVSVSKADISASIFGLGDSVEIVNLRSQYSACSFGKIDMKPAEGHGIIDGVGEIFLNRNITGLNTLSFENTLAIMTEQKFGSIEDNFKHVVYCMPPGFLVQGRNYIAYGYLNHWRSIFNDRWCTNFSVIAHEIGHNLNLRHSGEAGNMYQDTTCLMGFSSSIAGFPASCFNANKNYFLGWYRDRTIVLDMSESWLGPLVAFVDYDKAEPGQAVIVKIGDHFFLQYNRARGFNFQSRQNQDEVVIIYNNNSTTSSDLLGGVATGLSPARDTFRFTNYENSGTDLVIQACEQFYGPPDFVIVSIWMDNGVQSSQCNATTFSPISSIQAVLKRSPAPTDILTTAPTLAPNVTSALTTCKDSMLGTFVIRDNGVRRTCKWLSKSPTWQRRMCQNNNTRVVCPATCGACSVTCKDSPNTNFYINKVHQNRTCAWLSIRPHLQTLICHPGHPAFESDNNYP